MTNITQADEAQAYSSITTIHFQEAPGLMGLVNRAHEGEVTGGRGHKTTVQDVDFSFFGGDFVRETDAVMGTPQTARRATSIGLKQIEFMVNKQFDTKPVELYEFDEWGVPVDLDAKGQAKAQNELDLSISAFIASYWKGLGTFGTYEPTVDDLSKQDGSGPNGNAGRIFRHANVGTVDATDTDDNIGLNGNKADQTFGEPTGENALTVVGKGIYDLMRRSRRRFEHIYLLNGMQLGQAPGDLWAVADPAVWDALAAYYLDAFGETLPNPVADGLIGENAPSIFNTARAYGGAVFDHTLIPYVSPSFQPGQTGKPDRASGFPIFIGTEAAVTFAMRAVETGMNPKDLVIPGTSKLGVKSMTQWTYAGIQLINAPCITRANVVSVS